VTRHLCILSCHTFSPDVLAAVTEEGWGDVTVRTFPTRCGRPPLTWQELRLLLPKDCTDVAVIGRSCLKGLAATKPCDLCAKIVPQADCFDLVAGRSLVTHLIDDGAYLITPGWLERWRNEIADMGFSLGDAGPFFQEFARELVLLDTGSLPDSVGELERLASALGLPARSVPVGSDYVRTLLGRVVAEWRVEQERRLARERHQREAAERADQASAMSMLQGLAMLRDEAAVLNAIEDMVRSLFAPNDYWFVPVSPEGASLPDGFPAALAAVVEVMAGAAGAWAWTPSACGFLLRIGPPNDPLGILVVDGLAFPAFKERYLNLSMVLAGVFALAIENARSYQSLLRTTAELAQARDEAEAASQAKSQFIANMSHELRTPLNAVIGFSDILQWQEAVPQRREQLKAISTAGHHLLSLVQDLLDLSKIEARRIEPRFADIDLRSELASLRSLFAPAAEHKGLHFAVSFDPAVPPKLRADTGLLRQILGNLIGNAVKFTSTGGIDLSIRLDARDAVSGAAAGNGPVRVLFCIRDTGIGIRPENHQRIFEVFEQEDNTHTRPFGGTGLGLAITRRLVALLHGEIWLESVPGQGASFFVRLPFSAVTETIPVGPAVGAVLPPSRRDDTATILIVDDDAHSRALLVQILQQNGNYRPIAVDSGQAALHLLDSVPVDLILMDIQMPVMSGIDVTQRIRAGGIGTCPTDIPIIAVTAYAMTGDAERFIKQGVSDYISKPLRIDALMATVERHLDVLAASARV